MEAVKDISTKSFIRYSFPAGNYCLYSVCCLSLSDAVTIAFFFFSISFSVNSYIFSHFILLMLVCCTASEFSCETGFTIDFTYFSDLVIVRVWYCHSSRVCLGTEGKKSRYFVPNESKDHHITCLSCRASNCNQPSTFSICAVCHESRLASFHKVLEELATGDIRNLNVA